MQKLHLSSRKGKKGIWKRTRPNKADCLLQELKGCEPLKKFNLSPRMMETSRSSIYSIIKLYKLLKAEGMKYEFEKKLFERALGTILSSGKETNKKLLALGDAVGRPMFGPPMTLYIYLISCQRKKSLESLRLLNLLLSNEIFYRRMFYLGLRIINNETIENREKAFGWLEITSCRCSFDPKAVSVIQEIIESSKGMGLYWNLYFFNKIINNRNFSPEILGYMEGLPESLSELHWTLELADSLLSNRNFDSSWPSRRLFSDLHRISCRIAHDFEKDPFSGPFFRLRRFLNSSEEANPAKVSALRREIDRTEAGTRGYFSSIR